MLCGGVADVICMVCVLFTVLSAAVALNTVNSTHTIPVTCSHTTA